MLSPQSLSKSSRTKPRGSALLLTLVLIGVLAITISTMLLSVRHLTRSADDKIAMEECYQTALSGINLSRAWVMTPTLASQQTGNNATVGDAFEAISDGAFACSNAVIAMGSTSAVRMSASEMLAFYQSSPKADSLNKLGDEVPQKDGRRIIHEWNTSSLGKFLVIPEGEVNEVEDRPTGRVVATKRLDARSWIESVRITTPFPGEDSMRLATFIIEVDARTAGAGLVKQRRLLSKVLAIPEGVPNEEVVPQPPVVSSMAAVVAGGGISANGNSSMQVHWGPVWSKGDMEVLGLSYDPGKGKTPTPSLSIETNKYTGIGAPNEKWVKWHAGTGSQLVDKKGDPIFPSINGNAVTDLFAQRQNGTYGSSGNFSMSGFDPSTWNATAMTYERDPNDPSKTVQVQRPLYYAANSGGQTVPGEGAFVQGLSSVNTKVDQLYDSLTYTQWKKFAIDHPTGYYIRPTSSAGNSFVDENGQKLYVTPQKTLTTVPNSTPLSSIKQISMMDKVPTNGLTKDIPDQMLFIDSVEGTEAGSTRLNLSINSSDKFFWKGMIWHHGDMAAQGGGALASVWGQNPDQYVTKTANPSDSSSGKLIGQCIIDGIFRVSGNVDKGGNTAIYGSLVVGTKNNTGMYTGGGTFDVYYNPRVGDGLFKSNPPAEPTDPTSARIRGLVGGPIVEIDFS